ncbi:hypothetical protein BC941DRAFT_437611 [Chlamydoabsidia padenii]|nr:hypothetical protein BC941DRAFT_437611 [Chlamydoabsidia padenii]
MMMIMMTRTKKAEEDYIALNLSEENDTNSTDSSSTHNQQRGRKRQREDDVYNENDDDDEGNDLTHLYPWWQPYSGRPENRLQAEVEHFVDYLQPLKHEILLRHYLIHKIRYIIQEQWPDAEVQVFGSFKTNTFLPDSDMDLAVTLPVYQGNSTLYALARDLKQAGACLGSPEVIASASVPVIKFVESLTHIKVDIIISSRNGVECAEYVSEVLDQYPGARKLTLIVKHMVALRNLNEVFTGGIGGFGLVCMVISFLQMHPKVASGMIDPEKNLGVLLLDFLQLYGIQFAIGSVGISVVGSGSYYYQRSFCRRKGRPIFSIEDPLDSSNDIGSKSFNAVAVVKLFRNAYLTTFTKTLNVVAKSRGGKGKNRSSFTSNDTNSSLLSSGIAMIPETMINQRSLMQQVYSSRRWKHEPASNSFDWNMAV